MKTNFLQSVKGVRDFLPEDKIFRDNIVKVLVKVFEDFAYNPLETPVLENYALFAHKFSQGEDSDAIQECYKLKDRANRELVLRTEFTAPFARLIAMNKQLALPFKRYQIGKVFRDGPIKLGRYREFMQCDVDVVGIANMVIDAEIIDMANVVFKRLGLDVNIYFNSRKLLNSMLAQAGVGNDLMQTAIISIDKLDKIGVPGVVTELKEKGLKEEQINIIKEFLSINGKDNNELINKLREWLENNECLEEIEQTLKYVNNNDNVIFSPSLARGLGYYTGNVFEIFLKDKDILSSSLAGGGRYDEMITNFIDDGKEYPAIGISFGLDTICDALKVLNNSNDNKKVITQIYALTLNEDYLLDLIKLVRSVQDNGYSVDVNYSMRKFNKALNYVNNNNIPYVLILGDDEYKDKTIVLKDMKSGEQEIIKQDELINILKEKI